MKKIHFYSHNNKIQNCNLESVGLFNLESLLRIFILKMYIFREKEA